MPNHVTNRLKLIGEQPAIDECLEKIKLDEKGIGTIDFNKIIPMPASLDVTAGSEETNAIKAYLKATCPFNDTSICGIRRLDETLYLNILFKLAENDFLAKYSMENILKYDLTATDNTELIRKGEIYIDNLLQYGATTWYDWCRNNWGTKWNAYDFAPFENNTITFCTAWSNVCELITRLSAMHPDLNFEYSWADEDFGSNVGTARIYAGKATAYIPEIFSREAYEMAADIMGCSPEDYGLHFDKKKNNYVSSEDED